MHALPFSTPRNLKKLIRAALARRIPVTTALGPGARTIAVIGGGGAGKTTAIVHLASAYAAAGADVAVIALRGDGDLAHRLQPLGVGVIAADDAAQATERLGARKPLVTLIDTPATGPSHGAPHVKALAADLKALGATEVHLALPATLSSAAAGEVAAALAPLAPTHVALTHSDETARPGAPLELALARGPSALVRVLARRRHAGRPRRARATTASMTAAVSASAPTLQSGQHVSIRNVQLGTLPATVDTANGPAVKVALAVKDDRISRLVGHDMAIEATSARGIHRYGGTLSAQSGGSLTITLNGSVERIQRRDYVRVSAGLAVTVRGIEEKIGGETVTIDVSGSGIQIIDKWRLPLGLDVRVELQLPEGEPVRSLGRVVRQGAEEDHKGVRLDGIGRQDEDRLMRFIRDREVQALRQSRDR